MYAEPFLENQTALVTGGAKRLGRAVTEALAAHGAKVIIHYNTSGDAAEELCASLRHRGAQAWTVKADLSCPDEADACVAAAAALAGPLSILINSASIFPASELATVTRSELDSSVQINAFAPLLLARNFAAQDRRGHIINFLDTRIVDFDRKHVAYHLSKRMLFSLTREMADAFAPRIQVNGVAPGLILPPEGKDESYLQELAHTNPLQRYGGPEDITSAVLFLLRSRFITGQVIYVDGGRHMKGSFYG